MLECEEIFWFQCSVLFLEHFELKLLKLIFSLLGHFWKVADTEIRDLTLDTLQVPAGTCRLVIWSWISLMMNTWTIRLLISQYQGSGCQISCRTSTWRMICGAVPRTDWSAVRHSILNVWKRDCEWNLPWIIIRIVLQCILIYCNVLQCIVMVTWG